MKFTLENLMMCDYASLTNTGKLNLLGIFESFYSKETPFVYPNFFLIVDMVADTIQDKKIKLGIKLFDPQKKNVEKQIELDHKTNAKGKIRAVLNLPNTEFKSFGDHILEISIDGKVVGESKISVIERS